MKRILATATFLICSLLTTFAQFSGPGSGTEDDPYIIMSADQLYSVRNFLNNTNVYFSIICDIDLSDYAYGSGWEPIGNDSSPFKGKIEGNGFKITGLEIKKSTKDNVGLFGCTHRAVLKNITVEGNIVGNNYVGGIVGQSLSSDNSVEYENVHFKGTIKGNNYIGGIAGIDKPATGWASPSNGVGIEYDQCSFGGTISGNDYVGGIVGSSYSKITNCIVDATIYANQYVGGVSGKMEGVEDNLIEKCYVSIIISASSGYVGGVSGYGIGGDIKKCVVNGRIVALGDKVGGVIGYAHCYEKQYHDFYISDSYFVGSLKANDYVGGIIGYNGGAVWKSSKTYEYYGYVRVQNNYAKASIVGHDKVGGILSGYTDTNNPKIQSNVCMCTTIDCETENVGRIQARQDGATLNNCYSIYSTKVRVAGVNISEEEIEVNTSLHGTDIGEHNLKTATFYQGLSWDFASTWGILDTESVPYLQTQAAPPVIQSSLVSGETTISGNSFDGGNVRISIDSSEYVAFTEDNNWSAKVPELQSGTKVVVRAETENLFPSYDVECYVAYLGNGTQESPFLVKTYSDLKNMQGSGYYKLVNDIDMANALNEESPLKGWQPLGVYSDPIKNFDGGNHIISNLFISRDDDLVGLFSSLTDATIKNLTIEVAEEKCVEGNEKVGILAGRLNNCSIDNVIIKGTVKGEKIVGGLAGEINEGSVKNVVIAESSITGRNYIGGIAGTSSAVISLCSFDGNVNDIDVENDGSDNSTTVYMGGITAVSKGAISESQVGGNIIGNKGDSKVGGFVGDNYSLIANSYCTANVNGGTYAAGIAATNNSVVEYCYASGNITTTKTGSQTVSCGLIAYNNGANAVVSNCAAMNRNVISLSDVGTVFRVIGGITNGSPIPGNSNYTLQNMVLSVNGIRQSVSDNPFNGYKKDDECFTTQSFYVDNGWDFTSVWKISEYESYPTLKNLGNYSSCTTDVLVNNILLNKSSIELNVGEIVTISPTITPNGATNKNLNWESSNNDIATVSNGVVTAVSNGTATITATSTDGSNIKATCEVIVSSKDTPAPDPIEVTDISKLTDVVYVEPLESYSGRELTLSVKMKNAVVAEGFLFDLYLPDGVSVKKDADGFPEVTLSTERTSPKKTNSFDSSFQPDGCLRVLGASTNGSTISGNDGEIVLIIVKIADDIQPGDYAVRLKNISISDENAQSHRTEEVVSLLTISDVEIGDSNGDGVVDVSDFTAVAHYLLGSTPQGFNAKAADANEDGVIDVADLTAIAHLILYGSVDRPQTSRIMVTTITQVETEREDSAKTDLLDPQ